MIKVGIGFAKDMGSYNAGVISAQKAINNGGIKESTLVIAFCSNAINHESFFAGIQAAVGSNANIIGGSAVGVITNDDLVYSEKVVAVACIETDNINIELEWVDKLKEGEFNTGIKLIEKSNEPSIAKLMLLFYDSIKFCASAEAPPVLNASLPLLKGISENLEKDPAIIGAGLVGDYGFGSTKQFCGNQVRDDCAVLTLLSGNFNYYSAIMHGCTPKDGIYHTITKMSGQFVYEVDGRPIVEVINEAYGNEEWQKQNPVGTLTIGVNYGKKFSDYKESNYVNRLITGTLPDKSGIVLFEPDLSVGTEFQFMLRDSIRIIETTRAESEKLINRIDEDNQKPVFALYIDCAGRTAKFSNNIKEEAAEIQEVMNTNNIPLLGFYSGVEIAPLLGESRGLDWTGVLLILTEDLD